MAARAAPRVALRRPLGGVGPLGADIETALDVKVYFCDPRSPWQRPTNEQTNGLLRRWLPKSTDLNVGTVQLAIIEDNLNTMPRKLHDWHSAHSVYAALSRNHR